MFKPTIRFVLSTLLALSPLPAFATPVAIGDQMDSAAIYHGNDYPSYSSANFANRSAGGKHWGDEISDAGHPFDTTGVTIDRSAGGITFTMHTMFDGSYLGSHYADLFIDTANPSAPGTYNYAIALGGQTMSAGLYTISSYSTANDLWSGSSDVYGGYAQLKTTAAGYDPNIALQAPTRLDSGEAVAGYSASVSRTDAGGGFYDLTVSLLGDPSLFDNFDLFWGTGDCDNDAIWGMASTSEAPVGAPQGIALFALGLIGVAATRRRKGETLKFAGLAA